MTDLDALAGFTVYASWGNDGTAELSMRHNTCDWWLDDAFIPDAVAPRPVHSHPFEGSAPLDVLVGEARRHLSTYEDESS